MVRLWWLVHVVVHHVVVVGLRVLVRVVLLVVYVVLRGWLVVVVVVHGGSGVDEVRRAAGSPHDAVGADSGLQLARRVHHRRLVTVRLSHVHGAGRVRSVALHRHALLGTVVRGIPDVHAVVRREPRVGHALRWLAGGRWASVVVRREALPQTHHVGVAVGVLGGVALRNHRGTVMLVLLVRVLRRHHPAVPHVRHVRVGEVRTHLELTLAPTLRVITPTNHPYIIFVHHLSQNTDHSTDHHTDDGR